MSLFDFIRKLTSKPEQTPDIASLKDSDGNKLYLWPTTDFTQLKPDQLAIMAAQAQNYVDMAFFMTQAQGYWMSKDLTFEAIRKLEATHVFSILNMWKKRYSFQSTKVFGHDRMWRKIMVANEVAFDVMISHARELGLPIDQFIPDYSDEPMMPSEYPIYGEQY
jgi:hypothetical protein